jgi:hypothetical protein
VSAIEGGSALIERAQRQGETNGCRGPSCSIEIGRRGVRAGPSGFERVRAVRLRLDGGNQTGKDEWLRVALTGGPGRQARMRKAVSPRSGPFDLNQTVGKIRPGETDSCERRCSSPRR